MPAPIFLGDELAAAGYRLAGAQVRTPSPGEAAAALAQACAQSPLVLLSADLAAQVGAAALQRALAAATPLVLVVPDIHGRVPLPDLAARLRAQLGFEA